jgi:hypothetical protein
MYLANFFDVVEINSSFPTEAVGCIIYARIQREMLLQEKSTNKIGEFYELKTSARSHRISWDQTWIEIRQW